MNPRIPVFILSAFLFIAADAQSDASADHFYTNLLTSNVMQQARRIFPRKMNFTPPELKWNIVCLQKNDPAGFNIKKNNTGYFLALPANFNQWAFQPEKALMIMNTALSARIGSNELLQEPWITAAAIHDIYESGVLYGSDGFGEIPFARTMLAYGLSPEPEQILNTDFLSLLSGFSASNSVEWCAVMMDLCTHKRSSGILEQYVLENPELSGADRFKKIVLPKLESDITKKQQKSEPLTFSQWFRTRAAIKYLGRSTPAAAPWIEKEFLQYASQTGTLIRNQKEKQQLSEQEREIWMQHISKIQQLAFLAPEKISLNLSRYSEHLFDYMKKPDDPGILKKITETEEKTWELISGRTALEHALKSAEQRLIPPGKRFFLTMKVLSPVQPDIPLLKKANELLDRFEKD